ncbi:MAG: hypothetical protein JXA45_02215, partial [Methanomassiliicoccales archaeon]|nr:hypothetical protein [Methanomassiliicoccales archaeon]
RLASKRGKTTRHERLGSIVGVLLWIIWIVVAIILDMTIIGPVAIVDEASSELLSSLLQWLVYGPLVIFIFLGRHLVRFNYKMASGSLSNKANTVISLTSYVAWTVVLLVWDFFEENPSMILVIVLGWLFTYLMLVVSNRRWDM